MSALLSRKSCFLMSTYYEENRGPGPRKSIISKLKTPSIGPSLARDTMREWLDEIQGMIFPIESKNYKIDVYPFHGIFPL